MYLNRGGRHYWFAKYLIQAGYDVTIFCANTYHNKHDFIDTKKKNYTVDVLDDIPFVFVKTSKALGNGLDRIKNIGLFYKNLFPVSKAYAQINGKPDVILASSVHPLTLIAGIKVAKKLKVPCICEIRDLWPEAIFYFKGMKPSSLIGRILTLGEHWIYKKAEALIFTKEGDVDHLREMKWDTEQGGKVDLSKTHYINNGIDYETFLAKLSETAHHDEDLEKNRFNVVYIGSIRPVNQVETIVKAAKLLKNHSEIQFLIYGEGNQKPMIENYVHKHELSNVKIKGFIEKALIPTVLSKSDINLLNYSSDKYNWARGNSSNKLFEYMASGKPIIATIKMGYSIIERYQCGLELSENTPEKLAEAILTVQKMSQTEYQTMSQNAQLGAQDFDFKRLTKKLIQVIETQV